MTTTTSARSSQGEGEDRAEQIATCLAYTAEKGWHASTVPVRLLLEVQAETYNRQQQQDQLKPHGTLAAARRHTRKGTPKCDPCKQAENEYLREYRKRKKAS